MQFELTETITEATYGREAQGAITEMWEETSEKIRKDNGYIVNVIQVQGSGFTFKGDLYFSAKTSANLTEANYINLT